MSDSKKQRDTRIKEIKRRIDILSGDQDFKDIIDMIEGIEEQKGDGDLKYYLLMSAENKWRNISNMQNEVIDYDYICSDDAKMPLKDKVTAVIAALIAALVVSSFVS